MTISIFTLKGELNRKFLLLRFFFGWVYTQSCHLLSQNLTYKNCRQVVVDVISIIISNKGMNMKYFTFAIARATCNSNQHAFNRCPKHHLKPASLTCAER